jgi:hypothetical protein
LTDEAQLASNNIKKTERSKYINFVIFSAILLKFNLPFSLKNDAADSSENAEDLKGRPNCLVFIYRSSEEFRSSGRSLLPASAGHVRWHTFISSFLIPAASRRNKTKRSGFVDRNLGRDNK